MIPLAPKARRFRLALAVALVGLLTALALLPLAQPGISLLPACGFHTVTGLPCPLCGGTRAAQATVRGQPAKAFALNPLALPVVAGLALAVIIAIGEALRGRTFVDWSRLGHRSTRLLPLGLIFLLLVWWPCHLARALHEPKTGLVNLDNPIARAVHDRLK